MIIKKLYMIVISYSELLNSKEISLITYQDLLFTEEWKIKREEIIVRDSKRCTKCKYSETGGSAHFDEMTKIHSYLTDNGKEEIQYVLNSKGLTEEQSVPRIIVTDKPYFLHVHHKYYIFNQLPWEYEDSALITLCNWCHNRTHQIEKIVMYKDNSFNSFDELLSCGRCHGVGWLSQYSHVKGGICFECNGKRFKTELISK